VSGEFYIGYQKKAPAGIAKTIQVSAIAVVAVIVSVAAVVASQQAPIDSGRFEFGDSKRFDGVLYETPFPHLLLIDNQSNASERVLLTSFGKAGLPKYAQVGIGKRVQFDGSLIYRQNLTMIEMGGEESFEVVGDPPAEVPEKLAVTSFGEIELTGELVDTKCFLGVMRPGVGKVHRACASVCLRGGVPPGLLLRLTDGRATVVMLAGAEGTPLVINPEWAALEITARGTLEAHGDLPILRASEVWVSNGEDHE
jgi:hypothetical protein